MSTLGGTSKLRRAFAGVALPWALLRSKAVKLAVLALPLMLISANAAAQTFRITQSSGLFALPANAKSVDWAVVNNSAVSRTVRVTVYRHGIGIPRAEVLPGPLTFTLAPNEMTHNANSVGPGQPFEQGFNYEVQVETNSPRVHPLVQVWEDCGNCVIAGTAIPAGSWVRVN